MVDVPLQTHLRSGWLGEAEIEDIYVQGSGEAIPEHGRTVAQRETRDRMETYAGMLIGMTRQVVADASSRMTRPRPTEMVTRSVPITPSTERM